MYVYIYTHCIIHYIILCDQSVSDTKSPLSRRTPWLPLIFTELFGLQNSSPQGLSQSWALRWAPHAGPGDVSGPENPLMWSICYYYN